MNADTLLENFKILAEAPGGIDRLRELILKMAVSGKLVEQFQDDGDAGELVPKYVANQKQMTDDGVIGTQRFQRGSHSPQLPYHIPKNWRWHYLGDVGAIIGGGTPSSSVSSYWSDHDSVPWLTPADMRKMSSRYVMRGRRDITPKGLTESSAQLLPSGAVLFSSRAPIGHVAIAAQPLATNQGFKSCVPYIAEMSEYIYVFLLQIGPQVDANATGTTFKEVSGKQVAQILIPVPPLAEQRRIVAKVDELMALCDQLEQQQKHRDNLRTATRKSVIDAISTATTPEELETAWNRINNNWNVIADSPQSIESLRLMIFGLAARGHLTKKSRHATGSSKSKLDVLFPDDWVLRNIGEIGIVRGGKRLPKGNSWSTERNSHPYIRSTDIKNRKISEIDLVYVPDRLWSKISRYTVSANDLLITIAGTIGSVAVVPDALEGANLTENAAKISLSTGIDPRFIMIALSSPEKMVTIANLSRSTAQPKLALFRIETITIAVPPFFEQKLIVEKVDELMVLCDQIEDGLKARIALAEKFARSVVNVSASTEAQL